METDDLLNALEALVSVNNRIIRREMAREMLNDFELAAFERGQASIQEYHDRIAAGDYFDVIISGGENV